MPKVTCWKERIDSGLQNRPGACIVSTPVPTTVRFRDSPYSSSGRMEMRFRMARAMVLCAAFTAVSAIPSAAQVFTGRIDATVADSTGAVLPGVTVDIAGPQAASNVSDAKGEVHFLNLAPGIYTVSAKLAGFSDYVNKNVPVTIGNSVALKVSMALASVSSQVEVTAE